MDCGEDENATVTSLNTDVVSFRVSRQHPHHFSHSTFHTFKCSSTLSHGGQQAISPQETEYDFILDLLTGLKPFTIKLQGPNMAHSLNLPSPVSSAPAPSRSSLVSDTMPRAKVPSFATRRAACTHLTMERLYGDFTCNICSNYSTFGWVYCCTQDIVPEDQVTSDAISEISASPHQYVNGDGSKPKSVTNLSPQSPTVNEDARSGGEDATMPTHQLSPWIEKAIQDGHYTSEQVLKLQAQKKHVVDTAKAAIHQFEQSQTNHSKCSPQTPTTLRSIDANPHLPFPMINKFQEPLAAHPPNVKVVPVQRAETRMFPFCKFCACHLCRPTHRDRAWQCFDEIFETEHDIPFIHYDDCNRPLASRSIMSAIGLRSPPLPQRPLPPSNDSRTLYSCNEASQISLDSKDGYDGKSTGSTRLSTDIADMNLETESKGFRESMKRTLKNMLLARQRSARPTNRKHHRARDGTEADALEFDMSLWKELNDELLKEASSVPLPEKDSTSTDMEGLKNKEDAAEMGRGVAGVAVTEEAASLGTADVIISV